MHGNKNMLHSWDPCYELANWERKQCGQLEGSVEGQVEAGLAKMELEELDGQVEKQQEQQAKIWKSIII